MVDTESLLEKVEFLIDRGIGDPGRLDHIRISILEKKKLYNSDMDYVLFLFDLHSEEKSETKQEKKPEKKLDAVKTFTCPKCGNASSQSANFCPSCGAPQQKYYDDEVFSSRFRSNMFPFHFRISINSYQLLAILGGLASLIPSLVAVYFIDRVLSSVEWYTGRDLSGFTNLFIAAGAITSILCIFVIVISFLVKKPKKVGRILFFVSFAILVISAGVGVVGFVLILLAGIIALKRSYY